MSFDERERYREGLTRANLGSPSPLDGSATLEEVKLDFYPDARMLLDDASFAFDLLTEEFAPYGLVSPDGEPITQLPHGRLGWTQLARGLQYGTRLVLNRVIPPVSACPYHEVLESRLGTADMGLEPQDANEYGLDTFRDVILPGGLFAPTTILGMLRQMPALQELHGARTPIQELARNSGRSLLTEPPSTVGEGLQLLPRSSGHPTTKGPYDRYCTCKKHQATANRRR
jgi:hypothetical protein